MTLAPRPLLAVLAMFASLCLIGCGGAQSRYTSHMERGRQYLAQGNLKKASIEFRNALQIRPKEPDALYLSGQVAERSGNYRGAVGLYQAAIDTQPDQVQARASLGGIYVVGGQPDRALQLVEPYLAKHPDNAALLVVRGAARERKQDAAGARADAQRALQLDPNNERAVGLLAGIERNAGDLPGAITLVSGAVSRTPSSVEMHEVLAGLYFDSDQQERGREQLKKLIGLKPQELRYRYQLAADLSHEHQIDAAQHVLEDCVKQVPDSDAPKLVLADFLYSQRSPASAEKLLSDFIARNPSDYDMRLALGAMYERGRAVQDALNTYAEVVKLDGVHPHGLLARDRMAAAEATHGNLELAQKLIGEVLQQNPRDDDALAMRGTIEARNNDTTAAIADLRAALRDQPKAVGLRRTLARTYVAGGQPELAEEVLREAAQLAPKDPQVHVELAEVLVRNNNTDQAVTVLEDAVRATPTDPAAREALVRAYLAKHDLPSARKAAEDLKSLRPDSASGPYLAGLVAQAEGRADDSEKEFEHALSVKPDAIDALLAVSNVEIAHGQGAKAIARVQSVIAKEPNNALAQNLLGDLYATTKDYQNAQVAFTRATALAPHWAVPYRGLALLQVAKQDIAGAIKAYETGLKAAPNDVSLSVELASLDERQGRIDDAIARLDNVYKRNPGQQVVANNLAMLLATYKTDRADLDRARDLSAAFADSTDPGLLDTHGWVRYKRGEYTEALPILERALEREPDSKEIRYHAAMAELHAGQRERARDNLQSALSGSRNFVGSDEARAVLASLKDSSG